MAFLVAVAELGRLGASVEPWVDDVAAAADRLALDRAANRSGALAGRRGVGGGGRGLRPSTTVVASDVAAARARRSDVDPTPAVPENDLTDLAWALRRIAIERAGAVDLFPAPFLPSWRGHRSRHTASPPAEAC